MSEEERYMAGLAERILLARIEKGIHHRVGYGGIDSSSDVKTAVGMAELLLSEVKKRVKP